MHKILYNIVLIFFVSFYSLQSNAQTSKAFKLPAARTLKEKQLMQVQHAAPDPMVFGKTGFQMPSNVRYPGEFEESQAVLISWAPDWDSQGNVIGVDTYSVYGWISAQCAKYISDELPVWIRVPFAKDTVSIKSWMSKLGWPLVNNFRFYVFAEDDWWARDFGPNGIYYGSKDSVGFIDLKYYSGRDNDDKCPLFLSQKLGYKNFASTLNGEGGNLMSDGFGKIFFSSMLPLENTSSQYAAHSPLWTQKQTFDTIRNLFGDTGLINLTTLNCDGGTGHIDLYVKLMDEQTMFVAKYPDTVTSPDKKIIEDNYQYLTTLKSIYNRPYRIYRIPDPTRDDGLYYTTCDSMNFDARTFINGVTANKTFLYPSYSDDVDGNKAQTAQVTALYQKLLPGYKVIPIDSRNITTNGGGGAIHCITMQIPAENPVLFWHPSIDGKQPIQSSYHIIAKITNHNGIANAKCYWRKRNDGHYTSFNLTDSAGYFIGDIQPGTLTSQDWFIYYLSATTNDGKTAVKPISAPEGYYQVYFTDSTNNLTLGVNTVDLITEKNYLFGAYPNPASTAFVIPFDLIEKASVKIVVTDILGKQLITISKDNLQAGMYKEAIDAADLKSGVYFYSMFVNGEKISTRKLLIQK
jgi:agmatine/peptidylarginine deiminase